VKVGIALNGTMFCENPSVGSNVHSGNVIL